MTKTMKTGQVRFLGNELYRNWESAKGEIKMSGIGLYHLLALKKTLDEQLSTLDQAFISLLKQYGGTADEKGQWIIPPDRVEESNKALYEFSNEDIEIEYKEINLKPTDSLPVSILEPLFDFIVFSEE